MVRDLIRKEAQSCGFVTDIEHSGGYQDKRRPGDVIVFNYNGSKHLLIDIAVIDPTAECHLDELITGGAGAAASAYAEKKRAKYHDLDADKYDFLPFIIEGSGGFGEDAMMFVKELQRRKRAKLSSPTEETDEFCNNKLMISISLEVQRCNSSCRTATTAADMQQKLQKLRDAAQTVEMRCSTSCSISCKDATPAADM